MNLIKPTKKSLLLALAVSSTLFAATMTSRAQTLGYFENFDADVSTNWNINYTAGGSNWANIYFDYSLLGIPPAPHSTNGTTRGILMQANLDPAVQVFPSGVSVSPIGFGIAENFEMHWDMWLNYNKSGNGSSQVGGGGYGTTGTVANVAGTADAVFIGAITDINGAGFRVYSPGKNVSYQGGAYVLGSGFNCGESAYSAGDSGSGYVYAGTAGSRSSSDIYFATNFPGGNSPPVAQSILFPNQTNFVSPAGSVSFQWHDVSLKKVGNTITYRIDGILIATIDAVDATIGECCTPITCPGEYNTTPNKPLGGTNIMFNHYDINTGATTDPDGVALTFSLIDNVRITNFPTVVTVAATSFPAKETGPTPGVFTITRTSAGAPLTVNYTLSGTATSNVDYTINNGGSNSITFLATATSTNVTITPIDDAIAETTETVVMTLDDSTNYVSGGLAIIGIVDNETPQLALTNVSTQMFERTNDYATFKISRLGDTNTAFSVNLSFSGSATANVDYYADAPTFGLGDESVTFKVHPIEDALVETNETVICTLAAGAGYTIGSPSSATVTIVDSTLPPEVVLFSDNFNTDTSSNWTLRFGSFNGFDDYEVIFNYDYSADSIPSAPHSGGDTHGLKMRVNKIESSPFGAAGVNLYPNGQNFSGDFALRFDMYLIDAGGGSATEGGLLGINHSGTKTNWFRLSGSGPPPGLTFDGLFFYVQADNQSAPTDYALWSAPTNGNNPTKLTFATTSGLTGIFKSPPWAVAGLPANPIPSTNSIWADVEASQINNVVTLKVNNTQILSYTNTGGTTSGNIMMGYVDPFDSIGLSSSAVIYDNVRVIRAFQYRVTSVVKSGGSILIDFTHPATAEPTSAFKLQSSATVDGTYADISATITSTGIGTFHVVASAPSAVTYYRIRHL